jgi:uncharacterized protein (TIGR03118 family)
MSGPKGTAPAMPGVEARCFRHGLTLFLEDSEMNIPYSSKAIRFLCTLAVLAMAAAPPVQAASDVYQQHNLTSDGFVPADNNDPNLVNGWGVAFNPFGPVWVAANGTGRSTLYDGAGKPQTLVVKIPASANNPGDGAPTGIVFNGSTGFVVSQGGASAPSRFLFATEDGVIAGWAPTVDATNAIRVIDNFSATGAVYKGLALSAGGNGSLLYAADFHNNRIDVFDSNFQPVALAADAFTDPAIPADFAPFNVQAINGDIYVAYAKQDADRHDEVAGSGLGYVDVFDPNGVLIARVASQGALNAPWGMVLAPAGFGKFSNHLLIGNFGDGTINAYDPVSGNFAGTLAGSDQQPIRISGLWGLAFGNGFAGQPVNTLFFAAGPDDEKHGLYGRIDVTAGGGDMQASPGASPEQGNSSTPDNTSSQYGSMLISPY